MYRTKRAVKHSITYIRQKEKKRGINQQLHIGCFDSYYAATSIFIVTGEKVLQNYLQHNEVTFISLFF